MLTRCTRAMQPNRNDDPKGPLDPAAHADAVIRAIESRWKALGVATSLFRDAAIRVAGVADARSDLDLRLTLVDALRELTELDRAVLVLRFWEDRSVEETATMLKLTSGAVRTRSSRALARVRERLGADFVEFVEN